VAILIVQQMPPLNANRLRAHLRRRRLRGRPLHAAQHRAQLCDVVLVSFLCVAAAIAAERVTTATQPACEVPEKKSESWNEIDASRG
jgi:hypothetical protein